MAKCNICNMEAKDRLETASALPAAGEAGNFKMPE